MSVLIRRLSIFVALSLLIALPSSSFAADDDGDEQRGYSKFYNGAFTEYSVRGGPNFSGANTFDGWHFDAGLRQSIPMHIVDMRLSYQFDSLSATGDNAAGIDAHGLSLHAKLHPAYLALLGSDWFSYVVASLYFDAGIGGQFASLDPSGGGDIETDLGFVWSVGGGLDLPLWDPDAGESMWINLMYSYQRSDFDRPDAEIDLPLHMVFVGLGWRVNGLLW